MSWQTIAIADVLDDLSPNEQASLNNMQGGSTTQGNILANTVNAWRGAISAGGGQLDAEGLIPNQVRNEVIDIVIWRWIKKFPNLKNLATKERKDAYDEAQKTFKEIAKGTIKIELPAPATSEPNPAPVNAVATARSGRRVRTNQFDGFGQT